MNATATAPINFSQTVPAVTYQAVADGAATRVEREGKGGHVTLVRDGRVEQIIVTGRGVVGILGWSRQSDAWCVQVNATGFCVAGMMGSYSTRDEAIGEIGLAFLS